MNHTKIEWADYTFNPVTGCLHGCEFCYARRIDKRFGTGSFTPTFYTKRLEEPMKVKKPSRIFVGSMADLFGDWTWSIDNGFATRDYVVNCILNTVKQCPQHTFIFLTKNPRGMQGFPFPDNCWCGTSVEDQPAADKRIPELLTVNCKTLFASYEPALGPIDFNHLQHNREVEIDCLNGTHGVIRPHNGTNKKLGWLIIGAQTGPGAVEPNPEWINNAVKQAVCSNVPLFVKDNVQYSEHIRQWPERR